jgi:GYF domain 2
MSDEQVWRWATPDGKQRLASESELKEAFAKGHLAINTLVWRKGLLDWKAANEVPELRASVVAGESLIPTAIITKPGTSIPQKGGAAASEEEPPSPPAYAPLPKVSQGRPAAPAVIFERDSQPPMKHSTSDAASAFPGHPSDSPASAPQPERPYRHTIPMGAALDEGAPATPSVGAIELPPKKPASTLIIHAGAPQAEETSGEGDAAPIVVPSPAGAQAPRAITQPPPVNEGLAHVNPVLTAPKVPAQAARNSTKPSAIPKVMPHKPASIPSYVPPDPVSTSMILDPDATPAEMSGVFAPVSTSMLLPSADSSAKLPNIVEELSVDDLEPASMRTEELVRKASIRVPSDADATSKLPAQRARQASIPPNLPKNARHSDPAHRSPDDTLKLDAASRIGLSKAPPPDINPLSSGPYDPRRAPTIPPADIPMGSNKAVPVLAATLVSAAIAYGAYTVGKNSTEVIVPSITSPTVVMTQAALTATAKVEAAKPLMNCKLTASARTIYPAIWSGAGIEPLLIGTEMVVGMAANEKDAIVLKLDTASLAPTETFKAHSAARIARVVPIALPKLSGSIELEAPSEGVSARRAVAGAPGFIGIMGSDLVWSKTGQMPIEKVVTLASGPADVLRGAEFGPHLAYTYRQGAAVFVGTSKPQDVVQRIPGLGAQVGSPAIATLGGTALIAWADRSSAETPWKIRLLRHEPGAAVSDPVGFQPTGGPGGSMLSPYLVRVSNDNALILWTEEGNRDGVVTHEVRAQLLDQKAAALGAPFAVSAPDMNAGAPRVSMGSYGRALVTFYDSTKTGYTAAAAVVLCKEAAP